MEPRGFRRSVLSNKTGGRGEDLNVSTGCHDTAMSRLIDGQGNPGRKASDVSQVLEEFQRIRLVYFVFINVIYIYIY